MIFFPAGRWLFSAMVCDECFHGDSSLRLCAWTAVAPTRRVRGRCAEKDFFWLFSCVSPLCDEGQFECRHSTDGGWAANLSVRQRFVSVCIGVCFGRAAILLLQARGRRVAGLCDNVASMPLYAVREPFREGRLAVGDGHEIAFAEYGCPEGGAGGLFAWGAGGPGRSRL